MCGIAFGLLNLNVFAVAVTKALPQDKQGFAVGLASAGSTFGQFTLIPLFALLTSWRVGYIVLSVVVAVLMVPSVVLLRISRKRRERSEEEKSEEERSEEEGEEKSEEKSEDVTTTVTTVKSRGRLMSLVLSWPYLALSVSFFICGVTTTGFIETHLVSVAVHRGFTLETGAACFAVLCAVNGFSMISAGWLSDRYSRTILLSAIFLGRGLAYLILILVVRAGESGQVWLFTFSVLFGLCDYSVVPPIIGLVTSHAGNDSVGLGVGILLGIHSIGASLGALLGGSLFDRDGNYQTALLACALLCVVASVACLMICEPLFRKKEAGEKKKNETEMIVVVAEVEVVL